MVTVLNKVHKKKKKNHTRVSKVKANYGHTNQTHRLGAHCISVNVFNVFLGERFS